MVLNHGRFLGVAGVFLRPPEGDRDMIWQRVRGLSDWNPDLLTMISFRLVPHSHSEASREMTDKLWRQRVSFSC